MEIPEIYILIISVIASIFSIASTTIGIQIFNDDSQFKKTHLSSFNFLVINLVVSILVLLFSFVAIYLNIRH
jgi:uncharacterized BrkB/YihY/UPF0761 family membrane protein